MKGDSVKEVQNVDGITCDHCVNTIKEAVVSLVGISSVEVDIEKKQVIVEFDDKQAKSEDLIDKITEAGFEVRT